MGSFFSKSPLPEQSPLGRKSFNSKKCLCHGDALGQPSAVVTSVHIGQAPAHHFFLRTSDMTSDSKTYSEHTQFQFPQQNTYKIQSDLLSRKEAAAYLGVTPETLAVWHCTKRYQLAVVKIGRLCKYKRSDLDAFIANRTIGTN